MPTNYCYMHSPTLLSLLPFSCSLTLSRVSTFRTHHGFLPSFLRGEKEAFIWVVTYKQCHNVSCNEVTIYLIFLILYFLPFYSLPIDFLSTTCLLLDLVTMCPFPQGCCEISSLLPFCALTHTSLLDLVTAPAPSPLLT